VSSIVPYQAPDWRYLVVPSGGAPSGFQQPGFNDSAFATGTAAFGSGGPCSLESTVATVWPTNDEIILRRQVNVSAGSGPIAVIGAFDNDVEVYWNGVLLGSQAHDLCPSQVDFAVLVPPALIEAAPQQNTLAIRVVDRGDYSFADASVIAVSDCGTVCLAQFGGSLDPNQNNPTGTVAEPVNTLSGHYTNQVTDLSLPGRGLPLAFSRTYDSGAASTDGPFGPGWRHAYDDHLVLNPDGSITYAAASGAAIPYAPNGSGGYVGSPGVLSTLATAQGGYVITRPDGLRYAFDATGRLMSETDRNADSITFGYTGTDLTTITDTVGRMVSLSYDGSHHVTGLADPLNRTVAYGYDASGRLVRVTDTRGGVTALTYDAAGRLAMVTDQNGHTLVTNTYDAQGRVIEQVDARGFHTTFAWAQDIIAGSSTMTMTDSLGHVLIDSYSGPTLVSRRNARGFVTSYTYDAQYDLTSVTDPLTQTPWMMTYDARGNILTRTSPAPTSYVETFTYGSFNDVLTSTDRRGLTTTYAYDAAGNRTRTTSPDGSHTDATYDGHGRVLTTTDARGKTTTYGYDARSNLNRVTTPLGEVTTSTYDQAGRLATTVDPRGNVSGADPAQYTTLFAFDAANEPTTTTDPLGNVTTTTYDAVGNRLSVTDANHHATTYAYDAANHLLSVTDAAGGVTAYAYDNVGNMVARTDANNHVTTYTYDANNVAASTTGPDGKTWYEYHTASGVLYRESKPLGTIDYVYDDLGRPTKITNYETYQLISTFTYDADGNRLSGSWGDQTYAFDTMNRLTSVTDWYTGVFGYTYDGDGQVLTRTYPDGSVTTYTYDDDGRMATVSNRDTILPDVDRTAPSPPAGLTAAAVSTNQVNLAWSASTDNVGVQGYRLYRNGTYLSSIGPIGSTTFSDTGLTSGTAYTYKVTAIDAAGNESAQSTSASATPGPDTTPPTVPTNLRATGAASNRVNLAWVAATDNFGITGYRIYRAGTLIFSVAGSELSATDWNVAPSSTYTYTVAAVDAAGNTSGQSSAANATTPAGTGTAYAADTFTRTVSGGWGSADKGGSWSGTTTAFAVTGSTGTISLASATNLNGYLTSVAAGDQEVLVAVNVNQFATGGNTDSWVYLRRQDTNNYYAARLTFTPAKQILAVFAKTAAGTTTTVGTGTSTLTHVKTDTYWLRVQLSGTTSVNAKLRIWKVGTAEPTTWLVNATDTTPPSQLRGTGHVGIRLQAAGTGPFPIVGTYDGLALGSVGSIASPDIVAPTVPAGLATHPRSTSRIDLTWTASTDATGVQLYRVFRGGTQVATVNTPAYIDTGLATNTTYSYTVAALDAAGNASAQTGTVTGRTLAADTTKPSTPASVVASSTAWNVVHVTWAASTDNVGVTRYLIYRGGIPLSVVDGTVTTFTDRSTAASTPYSYTVKASDAAGNTTVASTPGSVTTPAIPPTTLTTTYGYDAAGNLASEATPDGVTAKYNYDRAGRLVEVANVTATGTLSRSTYRLDAVGNRLATTTTRGTSYYTYDNLNRLTNVCYATSCAGGQTPLACIACVGQPLATPPATVVPNAADIFTTYTYDAVGNRLTETTYLGTTAYVYDSADHLTSRTPPGGGATTYTYDAEGRQLTAGSSSFTYDPASDLLSMSVGSVTETFDYVDGVRIHAPVAGENPGEYVTDRLAALPQVAAETDADGNVVREYTYGLGIVSEHTPAAGPTFLHGDGLGSVTDVTSAAGTSLAWTEYQPFGAVRTSGASADAPAVPFAYTGQYLDATGLYNLRAREYDPTSGRFTLTDPVSGSALDPYVSAYAYAGNNPVRFTDPSGRCPWCIGALAGAGIGALGGFIGYTASAIVTGSSWDPGQALVATATSAGAGAVCGATFMAACVSASVVASEIQYQASPGGKSAGGYVGAGAIGAFFGRLGVGGAGDMSAGRFSESLVGRMAATFGLRWEWTIETQVGRSSLTNIGANIATSLWNTILGGNSK
jgi:RHS repeat-associated protein